MDKKIITISRQFGSAGRSIGKKVAQELGIPYYDKELIKQVAEKTGFSPYQYLTQLRVQKAKLLLAEPEHSIAEVAELVGMDPRNFSRLFKSITGNTPLTFRKKATKER